MEEVSWIDWHELEERIPLDELPAFHRAFLAKHRPEADWQRSPLRQVQGKVQATLKRLERQGLAKTEQGKLLVRQDALPERGEWT